MIRRSVELLILIAGVTALLTHAAPAAAYEIAQKQIDALSPALRVEFGGIQYLLNDYQIKQFLSLPDDSSRVAWLRIFWKSNDPTPTTDVNEMRIEHNIRVDIARNLFKIDKWPGWDKRGEVFIRYGPPSFRGKVWGEITHKKMYPPGEIWFYKRLNMLVSFQNFGLKGEYIYSIDPLGAAQNLSPEMVEFLLYDTEYAIGSEIPQDLLERYDRDVYLDDETASRVPQLPENIDALMDPDKGDFEVPVAMDLFQRDKLKETANNFEVVLKETPSAYPFNFSNKPLPFYFDVDQFKAGDDLNRVEVHLEVPVGGQQLAGTRTYRAAAVVWDSKYKEIDRQEKTITLKQETATGSATRLIPTQFIFSLERGYYRMSVSVNEERSGRYSAYTTNIQVEDFFGTVAVSSILFAQKISRADQPSIFTRGPLEIIPHPIHAYKRSFPIPIYFEIYNLRLDENETSSYTIEYKIVPHSPQKEHFWERYRNVVPSVSSRFEGSGLTPDEQQQLTIKTDTLHEGSYDFLITITDEHTELVAYRKASFSIIE